MTLQPLFTELEAVERCTDTILSVFEGDQPDLSTIMAVYDERAHHIDAVYKATSDEQFMQQLTAADKKKCSETLIEVQKKEQKIIDIISFLMQKTQDEQEALDMHMTAKKRYKNQGTDQSALFITSKLEG